MACLLVIIPFGKAASPPAMVASAWLSGYLRNPHHQFLQSLQTQAPTRKIAKARNLDIGQKHYDQAHKAKDMNFSRKNERVPICKSHQSYKYGTNTLIQGHFSRGVSSGAVARRGPSDLPPPYGWLNWGWWGHLSHMLLRNQTMAGYWGLAW